MASASVSLHGCGSGGEKIEMKKTTTTVATMLPLA
jgi:hypothetical protein